MIELNHIYNMDCLEGMKQIPERSIDLVVCDPPYLIGNQGGGFWSKAKEGNHYNARGTRKGMDKLNDIKDGIGEIFLDKIMYCHIEIFSFLEDIGSLAECLCNDCIKCSI